MRIAGCILVTLLLTVYSSYSSAQNLIINGSFNGVKGEDSHGAPWQVGSTPDLNDVHGNVQTSTGYVWVGQPKASKDGGTWQNLYSEREYLEQEIKLEVGKFYTLRFEYTSMGIKASGMEFSSPVGIYVYIDGEIVFKTPRDITPYSWENATFKFKATSSKITIRFSASDEQYAGIDGVSLVKSGDTDKTPVETLEK